MSLEPYELADGTPLFGSLTCFNRAGHRIAATSETSLVLDTRPPRVGRIVLPELEWNEDALAWISPMDPEASFMQTTVRLPGFFDDGPDPVHYQLCVGYSPLECDLPGPGLVGLSEDEIAMGDVRIDVPPLESFVNVWATDGMGLVTASSTRVHRSIATNRGSYCHRQRTCLNGTSARTWFTTFTLAFVGGVFDAELDGVVVICTHFR